MKKIINYVAIALLSLSLIVPAAASAGADMSNSVLNGTVGEQSFKSSTTAKAGDEVFFNSRVTNSGSTGLTSGKVKVSLPAGLSIVSGYTKYYYKDVDGTDKRVPLPDSIASEGVMIGDVGANSTIYVSYKTKVAANASGTLAPVSQFVANGVSLSASNASVTISGTTSTVTTNPVTTTTTTPVVTTGSSTAQATASLVSSVINETKGGQYFTSAITADKGDYAYYRMTITNNSDSTISNTKVRTVLPTSIEYVPGYAKYFYKDTNGTDKRIPLPDSISGEGVYIGDIAAHSFVYVSYKVKVSANATAGTQFPSHQVVGNPGVSLADNSGVITVSGANPVYKATASLVSSVINETKGGQYFTSAITADKGDYAYYRMTITNNGDASITNTKVRTVLPSNLEYVSGYAKYYYKDTDSTDKRIPLPDSISGEGVYIGEIAAHSFVYVSYKVKVSATAPDGTYFPSHQVVGDPNISLADNSGVITVGKGGVVPNPGAVLFLSATAKVGNSDYSNVVSAKRGDVVKFKVNFANTGNSALTNIRITNSLPSNMEYVAGSMKVVLGSATISTADSVISNGVSLGDLNVGANGFAEFSAKVKSDTPASISQLVYTANGEANDIQKISSSVTVNLGNGSGSGSLPETGTPLTVLALVLLAMFVATAGYIYTKESKGLEKALKLIRR